MMLNIKAALARRGLAVEHVVKCTAFLADIAEWSAFNEVFKKHFSQPYPTRSAIGATQNCQALSYDAAGSDQ
jgi:enamine deaminase RidA (YjgF/YER057c/UK114 family)